MLLEIFIAVLVLAVATLMAGFITGIPLLFVFSFLLWLLVAYDSGTIEVLNNGTLTQYECYQTLLLSWGGLLFSGLMFVLSFFKRR